MNKSQLIDYLSEAMMLSKKDVFRFLNSLENAILSELKKGGRVQWAGFGTWSVSRRPARKGINPATKERIDLPAINVPKFKPGKAFREMVRAI